MLHDPAEQRQDLRHRLRIPKGTRLHVRLSQLPEAARNQELLRLAETGLAREEAATQPACLPCCAELAAALQTLSAGVNALAARTQNGLVLPIATHAPTASAPPLLDEVDPFEGIDDVAALNFRMQEASGT